MRVRGFGRALREFPTAFVRAKNAVTSNRTQGKTRITTDQWPVSSEPKGARSVWWRSSM